jgi:predicted glycosyltransferase/CheY-like chemotaxis protein
MASHKILIVEDEMIVQMHLRRIVEAHGHAVVGTAASTAGALAAAEKDPPDLALMDVRLAGGDDGILVADQLRSRFDCSIVFITAHSDPETVARAGSLSAGYVVKPFTAAEVGAALRTALTSQDRERRSRERERELQEELGRRDVEPLTPLRRRQPFRGPTRLLVYSHDTLGLGHLRRCQNLIRGLAVRHRDLSTLLVTGSPMAHKYKLPPRTDYLKLPAVRKVAAESYEARSLAMSDEGILDLRKNLLLRTVRDYKPDVLLVDHSPAGMKGELLPVLDFLKRRGTSTNILGMRDVIDDPASVRAHWRSNGVYELMQSSYDHMVVYGVPEVYDTVREYGLTEELARKTRYVHYVGDGAPSGDEDARGSGPWRVVLSIGGGDGGADTLVAPFLEMLRYQREGLDVTVEVLLGPLIPESTEAEIRAKAEGLPVSLSTFVASPAERFRAADLVVATAGYNTSVEVLAHARRGLFIPRVLHRQEQWLRAQRFAELGLTACLHPDAVTPDVLLRAVSDLCRAEPALVRARAERRVPLDGAERFAEFCAELAQAR